jgi:hypothetical protein
VPPHAAFDEQFQVRRASLVLRKAVPVRVLERANLQPLGATAVFTIEKGAVAFAVRHGDNNLAQLVSAKPPTFDEQRGFYLTPMASSFIPARW